MAGDERDNEDGDVPLPSFSEMLQRAQREAKQRDAATFVNAMCGGGDSVGGQQGKASALSFGLSVNLKTMGVWLGRIVARGGQPQNHG